MVLSGQWFTAFKYVKLFTAFIDFNSSVSPSKAVNDSPLTAFKSGDSFTAFINLNHSRPPPRPQNPAVAAAHLLLTTRAALSAPRALSFSLSLLLSSTELHLSYPANFFTHFELELTLSLYIYIINRATRYIYNSATRCVYI